MDLYERFYLEKGTNTIRLLHLQRATSDDTPLAGSFHIASLDDPPRYVSVSYTWGELLLTHEIVCDGYMLLISENLYLALKRFRTTDAEVFWIDQICINQSDLQERSWQVQLMRDIYLKAEEVFAWLGNHTETTELGIAIAGWMLAMTEPHWDDEDPYLKIRQELWKSIEEPSLNVEIWLPWLEVFTRPWFSRVWIIQEFVSARRFRPFCGDFEFDPAILEASAIIFMKCRPLPRRIFWAMQTINATENLAHFFAMNLFSINRIQGQKELLEALNSTRGFQSSDPRDKIYSILGLVENKAGLPTPDYSLPTIEVYKQFARSFISSGLGLQLIIQASTEHRELDLPSWCPDWSNESIGSAEAESQDAGSFLGCVRLHDDLEEISVDGVLADTILEIGPKIDDLGYAAWHDASSRLIKKHTADRHGQDWINSVAWPLLVTSGEALNETTTSNFIRYHNESCQAVGRNDLMIIRQDVTGEFAVQRKPHSNNQNEHRLAVSQLVQEQSEGEARNDADWKYKDGEYEEDTSCSTNIISDMMGTESIYERMFRDILGRNLLITTKGLVGLGLGEIQRGDVVSIISGIRRPRILRKVEEAYIIIGSAFILELEDSEDVAIKDVKEIVLR